MTYIDAAYEILQRAGAPLHYDEIAQRALADGLIKPAGRTPSATMGSRLYTDTKTAESRFVRTGRGWFALAEKHPDGISDQIDAINRATRDKLRELLQNMPPARFEALITELLMQMGFDEGTVTVTPYGNDGGIDVVGIYRAAGLTDVNAAVQVKRWRNNVQAPTVTQLRGSLQVHQQGIIITTSDFSAGARKEAAAQGKTRIGLIAGNELLDLLIHHQVGVKPKTLTVDTIDDEWWGELISPTPEVEVLPPPAEAVISRSPTGLKPKAYTFLAHRIEVSTWSSLLLNVCEQLAKRFGPDFSQRVMSIRSKKREYFTSDPESLRKPGYIPSAQLWIETNFSARDITQLINKLLEAHNFPGNAIQVEFEDGKNSNL